MIREPHTRAEQNLSLKGKLKPGSQKKETRIPKIVAVLLVR